MAGGRSKDYKKVKVGSMPGSIPPTHPMWDEAKCMRSFKAYRRKASEKERVRSEISEVE